LKIPPEVRAALESAVTPDARVAGTMRRLAIALEEDEQEVLGTDYPHASDPFMVKVRAGWEEVRNAQQ
jgi:hypothetical protein